MKILATFCAAIGVTLIATYLFVSKFKNEQFERERALLAAAWESERAELEAALRSARRPPSVAVVTPTEPAAAKASAQAILERLKKTRVASGPGRVLSVRHIVHDLQSLVDLGPAGLPAIRDFLAKFEDVEYSGELREDERDLARGPDSKDRPNLPPPLPGLSESPSDGVLPASLRLGLVDVLKEMGGEQAEQILAEMLSTSGRGVEVAYVAKALQELAPHKYRDVAVAAAKDLLANPPAIDRPNRLDENAKNFLYGVLSLYQDESFASTAQNLLVTPDGRVDRIALNYLTATLKDESIPALYQAFRDERLTNMWERASLATQILSFAGSNQHADDIFRDVVSNEALPQWLRATAIQAVSGGHGQFFGGEEVTDPDQIKARIDLLNSLPEIPDERLSRARADALQKLSDNLGADPGQQGPARSFRTRLGQSQPEGTPQLPVPGGAR
ncbi:MAG: hypothetical protein AB9869_28125 [Verrucomicrobiia bacterium]